MNRIKREDIYIISRYSNLGARGADRALKENGYNNSTAWQKFIRILFMGAGTGFLVAGIVFFFAYNWASLHRFVKIGLAQGLVIATIIPVLLPKIDQQIRNIMLTGASVVVGALFAVFGQVYQTGANAYDFFLAWTVFITVWVAVSGFAPLWVLYLVLVNTTFYLYAQQVAGNWSFVFVCTVLFFFHAIILLGGMLYTGYSKKGHIPQWFLHLVALACITYATLGIISGIFDESTAAFPVLVLTTIVLFALGIRHALQVKSSFFLSVIPFSVIIILSALLFEISGEVPMFLAVTLFIITSVTLVIRNLLYLQKKWSNEKQ
jgi:uncharacterized membrane protein